MAEFSEKFWSVPPVTRTLVSAMFLESALVHGGLLDMTRVLFYKPWIFKLPPDMWRLFTPFLLTGRGFSFVFDLYFTYTYASGLELNSPRFGQPGDFFTYVCFVATIIVTIGGFILSSYSFTQALILALIYTFAQDNRGQKAHFVLVRIPVEYLPWAMLTLTLIMGGWSAALQQSSGVIAAHMYDFLTRLYPTFQAGRNYIQTPAAVRRYFGAGAPQSRTKAYGTSYRPSQSAQAPAAAAASSSSSWGSGWTSAFSSGSWGGRGPGRRLGGD